MESFSRRSGNVGSVRIVEVCTLYSTTAYGIRSRYLT
jgi:hypothetical protein